MQDKRRRAIPMTVSSHHRTSKIRKNVKGHPQRQQHMKDLKSVFRCNQLHIITEEAKEDDDEEGSTPGHSDEDSSDDDIEQLLSPQEQVKDKEWVLFFYIWCCKTFITIPNITVSHNFSMFSEKRTWKLKRDPKVQNWYTTPIWSTDVTELDSDNVQCLFQHFVTKWRQRDQQRRSSQVTLRSLMTFTTEHVGQDSLNQRMKDWSSISYLDPSLFKTIVCQRWC